MWCNVWGHSNAELVAAIRRQAAVLQHSPLFNLTHGPAEDLALEARGESRPGCTGCFSRDNGSSAMEIAFKMALQYWQNMGASAERQRSPPLKTGTTGTRSARCRWGTSPSSSGGFRDHLFGHAAVPRPGPPPPPPPAGGGMTARGAQDECLGRIEESFTKDDRIAAFVMESGAQLAGGAGHLSEGVPVRDPEAVQKNTVCCSSWTRSPPVSEGSGPWSSTRSRAATRTSSHTGRC